MKIGKHPDVGSSKVIDELFQLSFPYLDTDYIQGNYHRVHSPDKLTELEKITCIYLVRAYGGGNNTFIPCPPVKSALTHDDVMNEYQGALMDYCHDFIQLHTADELKHKLKKLRVYRGWIDDIVRDAVNGKTGNWFSKCKGIKLW